MSPRTRATRASVSESSDRPKALRIGAQGLSARELVLATLSEKQFQRMVVDGLKARGYVVWHFPEMRRSQAGWPDLTFIHPMWTGRLWIWELKRECGGIVSPAQRFVIDRLRTVPGIDARIVRPSDWDILKESL